MTPTKGAPPSSAAEPRVGDASAPNRPSAATVRKTIIQLLATGGPQTAKTLEAAVGKVLPAAEKPSVKQQLQVLHEGGYLQYAPQEPRRLELTDSGERWWAGIEALTPRAA